jgi:hypothetical protein
MENIDIDSKYTSLTYELKEGTKTSYYYKEGEKKILPNRISICDIKVIGGVRLGLKANYTKSEVGKYKGLNKDNTISTSIYPIEINYDYIGYGIVDERYKLYDLFVFQKQESKLKIHFFESLGKPEYKEAVIKFLKGLINK